MPLPSDIQQALQRGLVIPACPLALNAGRKLDERRQRASLRYYAAAGVGGVGERFVLNFRAGAQTLSMADAGGDMGGVAFWAHVGGFVSGLVMVKLFPERRRRTPYAYRYG